MTYKNVSKYAVYNRADCVEYIIPHVQSTQHDMKRTLEVKSAAIFNTAFLTFSYWTAKHSNILKQTWIKKCEITILLITRYHLNTNLLRLLTLDTFPEVPSFPTLRPTFFYSYHKTLHIWWKNLTFWPMLLQVEQCSVGMPANSSTSQVCLG